MASELKAKSAIKPSLQSTPKSTIQPASGNNITESDQIISKDIKKNCQYCCCHFPKFVGSTFKSKSTELPDSSLDSEYKPYFELETEEERLSYEYFKLLARVTYDELVEKHREQALEELHQSRLNVLLEELRLIEGIDFLESSSDECYSEIRIRIPEKRRSLRIKNKKRRFQKQKIRK